MNAKAGAGAWLDIPFVRQVTDGCGAASLAMVMRYWEKQNGRTASSNSDPEQIQHALYSRRAHGIYASEMQKYLGQNGFRVFAFSGTWDDIRQNVGKGRPLIVAVKTPSRDLHYMVIAGIDEEQHSVIVNDPARRKLLNYDRTEFERDWSATDHWTLLAVPEAP
jgi:predicted double-glycine peptidase